MIEETPAIIDEADAFVERQADKELEKDYPKLLAEANAHIKKLSDLHKKKDQYIKEIYPNVSVKFFI